MPARAGPVSAIIATLCNHQCSALARIAAVRRVYGTSGVRHLARTEQAALGILTVVARGAALQTAREYALTCTAISNAACLGTYSAHTRSNPPPQGRLAEERAAEGTQPVWLVSSESYGIDLPGPEERSPPAPHADSGFFSR